MGNGHVGPFKRLADRFRREGWRIVLIVRDISRVAHFFDPREVEVYQAPFKINRAVPYLPNPRTYSEMLLNLGYREIGELSLMVSAWRRLFDCIRPNTLVFDHSPTAIIAARGLPCQQVSIGHGFYVPRDEYPLAPLAPWENLSHTERLRIDDLTINNINQTLGKFGQTKIDRVGEIFTDLKLNIFTTFKELDHNGPRDVNYVGSLSTGASQSHTLEPSWPAGNGNKVFVYLKPMPGLELIFHMLSSHNAQTIAVLDGADTCSFQGEVFPGIYFCNTPISLVNICKTCDLAITNASHATMCQFLLQGVSQMLIPLTLEQAILSSKIKSRGAGLDGARNQIEEVLKHLSWLLEYPRKLGGALAFQRSYISWNIESAVESTYSAIIA